MFVPFRSATFNMENLFSRAKALNPDYEAQTSAFPDDVKKLEQLLGKNTHSPADKVQTLSLFNSWSKYIERSLTAA